MINVHEYRTNVRDRNRFSAMKEEKNHNSNKFVLPSV